MGAFAAVAAAVIAAAVAVRAYRRQQAETRRQQKVTFYPEAMRTVEDYAEAPYRIRRRDGTAAARSELAQHLSDVKSRISFYTAWMTIHGTDSVATAYHEYVVAARTEAGQQMTAAWRSRPTWKDRDVPLGTALPRARTDAARATLLAAMKTDLGRSTGGQLHAERSRAIDREINAGATLRRTEQPRLDLRRSTPARAVATAPSRSGPASIGRETCGWAAHAGRSPG